MVSGKMLPEVSGARFKHTSQECRERDLGRKRKCLVEGRGMRWLAVRRRQFTTVALAAFATIPETLVGHRVVSHPGC